MKTTTTIVSCLAAAAIAVSVATPAFADADIDKLYEAAKKEEPINWYEVPMAAEVGERVAAAFMKKYPGVQVTAQRAPAQTFFQKVNQEIQANVPGADVFTSSVTNHLIDLKARDLLLKYEPKSAATMLDIPGVKGMDPDGYYHGTIVYPMTILINTKQLSVADAPKSLKDILDKIWDGKVAVANPSTSGTWGTMVVAIAQIYGMEYIDKLAENHATVVRSLPDVVNSVKSGEHWIGIGPASFGLDGKAKGQPLDVIYQTDGVMPAISPTGILKKTKSPNASKLFVEFLHSADMSVQAAESYNESLHASVPPAPGGKSLADVKVILPTDAEVADMLPKVQKEWKKAFGL